MGDTLSLKITDKVMNVNKISEHVAQHATVNHLLTKLPVTERDVLMLRYHMDLSLRDMSLTLGIGLSATKIRLYHALEKLAVRLENDPYAMNY